MKFDVVLTNPPYSNTLHLDFLDLATGIGDHIAIIQPGGFLFEEKGTNKRFIRSRTSIEGHVVSVIAGTPTMFFDNVFLNGQQIAISIIDMTRNHPTFDIEYRQLGITKTLNHLSEINAFGNNPHYETLKQKVLKACNDKTLKDVFEMETTRRYVIEIGQMSNYCFFGINEGKGGVKGPRKIKENVVTTGLSFDDKDMAEAVWSYLRNPISIMALHIAKKNINLFPNLSTTPWFENKEDFRDPAKALGLTQEEVDFAQYVFDHSELYFKYLKTPWKNRKTRCGLR